MSLEAKLPDGSQRKLTGRVYPEAIPGRIGINSIADLLRKVRAIVSPRRGIREALRPESIQLDGAKRLAEHEDPVNWGVEPEGIGISLSGGGIRSASYCLGALQEMSKHSMLHGPLGGASKRAKYLSAVSGGSYIATALAMVTRGPVKGADAYGDNSITPDLLPPAKSPDQRPFAPGTPEERFLRDRILYLTHGHGGVPAVVWRAFLGIALNVSIFALTLAVFALPLGWLYGWVWPSLKSGCTTNCSTPVHYATPENLWLAIVVAFIAALIMGFGWVGWRFKGQWTRSAVGAISGVFFVGGVLVLLFGVGIPHLIHLAVPKTVHSSLPSSTQSAQTTTRTGIIGIASAGAVGLVLAWIETARRLLATPSSVEKGITKALTGFIDRHRALATNVVATVSGPLLVLVSVILLAYAGALFPPGRSGSDGRTELVFWSVSTVLIALIWWRADITAWSLHPFYRRRLSAAFVVGRIRRREMPSPTAVGGEDASERAYAMRYLLTECQPNDFPELLICAAANISDYGSTPSGSHVTSFVFSAEQIGGPLVGAVNTTAYEEQTRSVTQSRFTTLPTAMAISGAALAPSMGRMTRAPFRFFMALANIRLGVWVPNPRRLEKFKDSRIRQPRPGPQYFVREMLGRNHLDAPFLYVSDGGHYENLGVVELLRRKCKVIWCIDASGDAISTFDTLGGALRIADAELGVSIAIDPKKDMAPQSGSRFVKSPFAYGKIRYADGTKGSIVVVKAGVPENAPWSVRSFHSQNEKFPCDPTLDQLYDAERFDAYRELGAFSMAQAIDAFGEDQTKVPTTGEDNAVTDL